MSGCGGYSSNAVARTPATSGPMNRSYRRAARSYLSTIGARGGSRTHTLPREQRSLSPLRLPVPSPGLPASARGRCCVPGMSYAASLCLPTAGRVVLGQSVIQHRSTAHTLAGKTALQRDTKYEIRSTAVRCRLLRHRVPSAHAMGHVVGRMEKRIRFFT
jgi:hypothetical protein